MSGFHIKEIRLTSPKAEDASIKFFKGLNIVSGASDTGKTYIFQCIDYMMGSSKAPKRIKEAQDYTHIIMEIETNEGVLISFKRQIGDAKIYAAFASIDGYNKAQSYITLDAQHDATKKDNISLFLLNRIGIRDTILLKKNQKGEKRTLSFRDLCHLTNVDELNIIKEISPVLSGQYTSATVEKSIFKYILSGVDDEKCGQIEDPKLRKAKIVSVIDFINQEIATLSETLENVENELNIVDEEQNELKILDSEIEEFENLLKEKLNQKKLIIEQLEGKLSEKQRLQVLNDRFELLEQHYLSDLERLQTMEEGLDFISQVEKVPCPICNNNLNHGDISNEDSINLSLAYQNEQKKINMQLIDLRDTARNLICQISAIDIEVLEIQSSLNFIDNEISNIKPQLKLFKKIIKRNENYIRISDQKEYVVAEISNKTAQKIAYEENSKKAQSSLQYIGELSSEILDEFCDEIENTLKNWCFDDFGKVSFDKKTYDIVVGDKERGSYGKGYRAFLYSAFVISLLRFTVKNSLFHSGIVILDSPLVTLKEKDNTDVPDKMQNAMFNDISINCSNEQVIIFENKQPTTQIEGKVNRVIFTKNNDGRYGFFKV